jgi:hypothetical protein
MLKKCHIKSLCQLASIVYKPNSFFQIIGFKIANWFGASYDPVDDHNISVYYEKICSLLEDDH